MRGGRQLGADRSVDLSADIGSILDVNASREDEPLYIRELYWAHAVGEVGDLSPQGPDHLALLFRPVDRVGLAGAVAIAALMLLKNRWKAAQKSAVT